LSVPAGKLSVKWTIATRNNSHTLAVVWRETGGPPVGKRKTDGFGSALIDTVFADAEVEREFCRDGFVCSIVCTTELVLPEAAADGTGGEP
jgi:two-component sensor histidine kinase